MTPAEFERLWPIACYLEQLDAADSAQQTRARRYKATPVVNTRLTERLKRKFDFALED